MTCLYLGASTLAVAMPGAAAAALSGKIGIDLALPDAQARLSAFAAFHASVGDLSFAQQLTVAASIAQNLTIAQSLGLTPPSIDAQIGVVNAAIATIEAAVGAVHAHATVCAEVDAACGVSGEVKAFAFAGDAASLAAELAGAIGISGAGGHVQALVLLTSQSTVWDALGRVIRVTP